MGAKAKVLVVDDDRVSITLMARLIEKLGHDVVTAANVSSALTVLRGEAIHLVIADYEMPGQDGLQLLKESKHLHPRLPFVLVTAYSNLKVIREAWEFGAFDFFQKPVFVDRFNQVVKLAIDFGDVSISRRAFPAPNTLRPEPQLLDSQVVTELAMALNRVDLLAIADEFTVLARIEVEQLLRFALDKDPKAIRETAHRLAGSAVNLGAIRFAEAMRSIETSGAVDLGEGAALGHLLDRSIYVLQLFLAEFYLGQAVA